MKIIIIGFLSLTSFFIVGCLEQSEEKIASASIENRKEQIKETAIYEVNRVFEDSINLKNKFSLIESLNDKAFCYVGQFVAIDYNYDENIGMRFNKITIQFDSIINDTLVFGHSIVAGNIRSFKGVVNNKTENKFLVFPNVNSMINDITNLNPKKGHRGIHPNFFYYDSTNNNVFGEKGQKFQLNFDTMLVTNPGSARLESSYYSQNVGDTSYRANFKTQSFKILSMDLKEPGDNKYDGIFSLLYTDTLLLGNWESYDKNLEVTNREFKLTKRLFKYNPELNVDIDNVRLYDHGKLKENNYIDEVTGEEISYEDNIETVTDASSLNASAKELNKSDLENLYKTDLEIIRNSIYARHGYSFKNRKIRNIFDQYVEWYIPFSVDVTSQLTPVELKNIELIKRYENHAETYYDAFGR